MIGFLSKNQKHILGIFGGVGPLSHIDFEKKILGESYKRGARSDQDHPVWILVNSTSTPDRTTALLKNGEPSLPHMIHFAKLLQDSNCEAFFVICNTAHGFHKEVQQQLKIPWIHLMEIVAAHTKNVFPLVKKVGILGTDATISLKLYHSALEKHGIAPISPTVGSNEQQKVMDAIYDQTIGVKATGANVHKNATKNLINAAEHCRTNGAEAIIAGCTEISVALTKDVYKEIPIIDPLEIAAKVFLDISFGKSNPNEFLINY